MTNRLATESNIEFAHAKSRQMSPRTRSRTRLRTRSKRVWVRARRAFWLARARKLSGSRLKSIRMRQKRRRSTCRLVLKLELFSSYFGQSRLWGVGRILIQSRSSLQCFATLRRVLLGKEKLSLHLSIRATLCQLKVRFYPWRTFFPLLLHSKNKPGQSEASLRPNSKGRYKTAALVAFDE